MGNDTRSRGVGIYRDMGLFEHGDGTYKLWCLLKIGLLKKEYSNTYPVYYIILVCVWICSVWIMGTKEVYIVCDFHVYHMIIIAGFESEK